MQTMKKGGNHSSCERVPWMLGASGFLHLCLLFSKKILLIWRGIMGKKVWLKNDGAQSLPLISHWVASRSPAWQTPLILNCTYITKCMCVVIFFLSLSLPRLNLDPEKGVMSAYPECKPAAANRPPFIHFKWRAELIKNIPWWHK